MPIRSSWCIAADSIEGILDVADIGNHRIEKFTIEGKYLNSCGNKGTKNGQLDKPAGMDLDSLAEKILVLTEELVLHPNSMFSAHSKFMRI